MTKLEHASRPNSWALPSLLEIANINPKFDREELSDNTEVSFVPMPAVSAETGVIDVSAKRPFGEVKKGFTPFKEGDVLFAKITPCMENGKMAIVPKVANGHGFGSTEFHVLRPYSGIDARYIYYFVSSDRFRRDAEHNMTGAVGQRRVPKNWLANQKLPLPPRAEQDRIASKLDELFSELDSGIDRLTAARQQLNNYRYAILKYAFEGKLSAQWRNDNKLEQISASDVLKLINDERASGASGTPKKPSRVTKATAKGALKQAEALQAVGEIAAGTVIDGVELPELPFGWAWVLYGELCSLVKNGISEKPVGSSGDKIFRISAVRPFEFDLNDFRYIDNSSGKYDSYRLSSGDLVFTRYNGSRAYVGVCAEYKGNGEHLFPDKLVQTKIASKYTISGFLEKALNSGASRQFVERRIRTTAGQSGVSGGDIKSIPVPICGLNEQLHVQELLDAELTRTTHLIAEIDTRIQQAGVLRSSILKRAFSGMLLPQHPEDEPAADLLKKIRREEERNGAGRQNTSTRNAA
jgi:type I restriction enzyme S subunit